MSLELLPVGMMGVMITAMFSATMSTLSSEYNVLASVATRDIYARIFRPQASEEHLLERVLRVGDAVHLLVRQVDELADGDPVGASRCPARCVVVVEGHPATPGA